MKNELLAPAGNLEAVKVAINYGADAVYCAGKRFGARSFIANLSDDEIIEAAKYVHLHSKKIYITLNTLIFEDELEEVKSYIDFLYHHVDALIVQDFGVVHYVRGHYPDFPIHISTQCSIHNIDDVKFLKDLGVNRIVLARELSLREIKEIKDAGIDLEIFIHGALCFSFSGMCYLSYYKGGRSGNRGSCAQPCRQTYSLYEDDKLLTEGALLSMKDLNTIDKIKSLLELGITSLKIEGRAKSIEYLASVVKIYRQIIDDFNNNKKINIEDRLLEDLYSSYSREKTIGYLFNEKNKDITTDESVKHQGIFIGKVIEYKKGQIKIKLYKDLELLDGVRIISDNKEYGLTVTRIIENGNLVKKGEHLIYIDVKEKIEVGSLVFKTSSSRVKKELKNYQNIAKAKAKLNICLDEQTQTIDLKVNDINIHHEYHDNLQKALTIKDDSIKNQFAKTNNLPIEYETISLNNKGAYYISITKINEMRTALLKELKDKLESQLWRISYPYPFKDNGLYSLEKSCDELIIKKDEVFDNLIDYRPINKKGVAFHLAEIGKESIISPYFGITNSEAIKFFRNMTNGVLILSYESTLQNSISLSKLDKNLGYLTEFNEPLMVSKHCPVAKFYGVDNKGCVKCKSHRYTLGDLDRTYNLQFKNCYMFIEGKKISRTINDKLIAVKII